MIQSVNFTSAANNFMKVSFVSGKFWLWVLVLISSAIIAQWSRKTTIY